jgi:hypothetical protein
MHSGTVMSSPPSQNDTVVHYAIILDVSHSLFVTVRVSCAKVATLPILMVSMNLSMLYLVITILLFINSQTLLWNNDY